MTALSHSAQAAVLKPAAAPGLTELARWPGLRVLTWDGEWLYASRRYTVIRFRPHVPAEGWAIVGRYNPVAWRQLTSRNRLMYRLFRDGFHGLAVLPSSRIAGIVPGAIVTLDADSPRFEVAHRITRGTRPLNIAATPDGQIYFGEYFDNRERDEVHVYGSDDGGTTWYVVHTFPKGAIRHVHNVVYDQWRDCLWILTGDEDSECRIVRASRDWRKVETIHSGSQHNRAVAFVCSRDSLYFATDSPSEINYICRLDPSGRLSRLAPINSTSFHGCQVGESIFFSTVVEPSEVNIDQTVSVYGSTDAESWTRLLDWRKDRWPMSLFQYGNAVLPGGRNETDLLAVTGVGVNGADLTTGIWQVEPGDQTRGQ